jgi:hypothetical protein
LLPGYWIKWYHSIPVQAFSLFRISKIIDRKRENIHCMNST